MAMQRSPKWHFPEVGTQQADSEDRSLEPEKEAKEESKKEPIPSAKIPEGETEKISFLLARLDHWVASMERLRLADYMRYVDDRRRMFWNSFWGGIARGVGMAVGFSVLGALLIWILQDLAKRNLPLISDLLTYIMEAVRPD